MFPILLNKYINVLKTFNEIRNELNLKIGKARILQRDARNLQSAKIKDQSIDGIITSPPYSFAIDYLKGDKSQLSFLQTDLENLKEKMIGLRGKDPSDKVQKYLEDITQVLLEMYRVLKDDKYVVIVIGTNTSQLKKIAEYLGNVKLEDELIKIAMKLDFKLIQRILRPIEGIRNSIRNEEIIILKK